MTQDLRYVLSVFVALGVLVAAFQVLPHHAYAVHATEAGNTEKKQATATPAKVKTTTKEAVSLSQIIELLISLEIIPEDKAEQARAVLDEQGYVTPSTACPSAAFQYNLYLGMTDGATNGEVTRLQKWLADMPEIYPEGMVTGYFGPATEQAVQRYQAKHGVVSSGAPEITGYGVVGPKTRTKVNACISGVSTPAKKDVAEKKEEKGVTEKKKDDADTSEPVTDITLHADEDNGKVWWETTGYSSKGYKVVWSKDSGPTYPTRSGDKYQYYSSPYTDHARLGAFDGTGMYYVRVCEYTGGACDMYSNEVTLDLDSLE